MGCGERIGVVFWENSGVFIKDPLRIKPCYLEITKNTFSRDPCDGTYTTALSARVDKTMANTYVPYKDIYRGYKKGRLGANAKRLSSSKRIKRLRYA